VSWLSKYWVHVAETARLSWLIPRLPLRNWGWNAPVEKVTDFAEIAKYGVMSIPSLVIDEKVVSTGKGAETQGDREDSGRYGEVNGGCCPGRECRCRADRERRRVEIDFLYLDAERMYEVQGH